MLSVLHLLLASLAGCLISWKLLRETSLLLVLSSGPLFGTFLIIFVANWGGSAILSMIVALALLVGLFFVKQERPKLEPISKPQAVLLAIVSIIVVVFTYLHNIHLLDTDRYLHDLHIVAFSQGVYPPVNPFFPHLAMNGHFGRDLFMSALHVSGSDPHIVITWTTPIIQLSTFLMLFAATQTLSGSYSRGMTTAAMVFFGMDVGFRVGLIDTFDGSNALAHPWLLLLMYLMVRLKERPTVSTVLVSGAVLGTYQLVYMTSFALLLVTGFILYLCHARSKKEWGALVATGILAMGLAVTEGGAFTDLAQRGSKPELTKSVQNQGLRVSVTFPKEHLFQVVASTAEYQRVSVAYKTSVFQGLYDRPTKSGHLYIWDPDFLTTHWLPLYLAPFVFFLIRRSSLALGFWIFGAISYLLPGLVYFGPIFEYEYYRWEFTAALGFAGALGYALGGLLEKKPMSWDSKERSFRFGDGTGKFLAATVVLVACLLAGEKVVNDMVITAQKSGRDTFLTSQEWRLSHPEFQVSKDELEAASWLGTKTEPGARILTNRLDGTPLGMWPDTTIAILARAFPAGHAYPPKSQLTPHGNPAFLPNSVFTAFWSTGEWSLLRAEGVSWVVARTASLDSEVVELLRAVEHKEFGTVIVAKVPEGPTLGDGQTEILSVEPPDKDLRLGHRYPLLVKYRHEGPPERVLLKINQEEVAPLAFELKPGEHDVEWSVVTSHDEGSFEATLVDQKEDELAKFSFEVDFLKRLEQVELDAEWPQFRTRQLYHLDASLKGPELKSSGEVKFYYRFRRPDGDYAWEVDAIEKPIDLELPVKDGLPLTIITPELPGPYELEFWFFHPFSGRRVKMLKSVNVGVESP